MFRPGACHETIQVPDETIFPGDADTLKRAGPKPLVNRVTTGRTARSMTKSVTTGARRQGTNMIKALSAIAIAAFIAAALTVLPGFAPQVEASVPVAMSKSDRLDIRAIGKDCSQQAWPNFEASCLRNAVSKTVVMTEARIVTTTR